ncbi:hypothetical protein ACRS52_15470 [Bacillus cytotoxicus]|uniref:Uncharacterized protein n=1 Tax=Bacillus cytotoxicus TaxID=580165 RepID=A0AAX2CF64_9BACI|nr:hypothetical protein [Bacillus cytotoxicus]QTR82643.1 hypothetical protein JC777_19495 [Bacillus cytotoxicus]QTR86381.1 hypothetical protein JC774_18000 [Bacillus cytotoxicus]SCL89201.1 Uncharacterized protein BCB44BAC_01477 [Bacillus cytotoxicus]
MDVKRIGMENKTLDPFKQSATISKQEIYKERKQSNLVITTQSQIITKNHEIGILLANLGDGKALTAFLMKEIDTILQLFSKLHTVAKEGKQSEQIYEQIVRSIEGIVKQAHVKGIPLLDGTYDYAEVQLVFGRKVFIPLLDVSGLLSLAEQNPSQGNLNMIMSVITTYMTKLSNETSLINGVHPSQDRDVSVWRALAEMNMTQLSHHFKKAMQEHKWSITICFLLIWIVCILFIRL